ncbi:MAG TPA: hypothetical protein VL358_01400 [Caulobacteraceae bacterium]|jgi:hypothetical protein|nr:hypothetical protein [Caulobacteraceae bacterium]
MKSERLCWGIYRESSHSPGRVDDDAAILDAVGKVLSETGFTVAVVHADAADVALQTPGARIFCMCEQEAILARLDKAVEGGAVVINTPAAIRNTYRSLTRARFIAAGVSAPQSWLVSTADPGRRPADQVWIKRADFHATQADDVIFAADDGEWASAIELFARRGMGSAVVQVHAPGDLIKFYGVRDPGAATSWFEWFYHQDQTLMGHAFEQSALAGTAFHAAEALGVDVFGGDAIIGADGSVTIIDLNAWPSFARKRASAAAAIAARLTHAFEPELSVYS